MTRKAPPPGPPQNNKKTRKSKRPASGQGSSIKGEDKVTTAEGAAAAAAAAVAKAKQAKGKRRALPDDERNADGEFGLGVADQRSGSGSGAGAGADAHKVTIVQRTVYNDLFKFLNNSTGQALAQGLGQCMKSFTDLADHDLEKLFHHFDDDNEETIDPQTKVLTENFVACINGQIPYFERDSIHANPIWARLSMEMTVKTWRNIVKGGTFDTSPGIKEDDERDEVLKVMPLLCKINYAIRWNAIMHIQPGKKVEGKQVEGDERLNTFLASAKIPDKQLEEFKVLQDEVEESEWFEANCAIIMETAIEQALVKAVEERKLHLGASNSCLFPGCVTNSLTGCHYCENHREVFFLEAGCRSLRTYTLGTKKPSAKLLSELTNPGHNHNDSNRDVPFFVPALLTLSWMPCLEGFNAGLYANKGLIQMSNTPHNNANEITAAKDAVDKINDIIKHEPLVKLISDDTTMLPEEDALGIGHEATNAGYSRKGALELARPRANAGRAVPSDLLKLFNIFARDDPGDLAISMGIDENRKAMFTSTGPIAGTTEQRLGSKKIPTQLYTKYAGDTGESQFTNRANQPLGICTMDGATLPGTTIQKAHTHNQIICDEGTGIPMFRMNPDHIRLPNGYLLPAPQTMDSHITPLNCEICIYRLNSEVVVKPFRGSLALKDNKFIMFKHDDNGERGLGFVVPDAQTLIFTSQPAPGKMVNDGNTPMDKYTLPSPVVALGSGPTINSRMSGAVAEDESMLEITAPHDIMRETTQQPEKAVDYATRFPILMSKQHLLLTSIELTLKSIMSEERFISELSAIPVEKGNIAMGLWAAGMQGTDDIPADDEVKQIINDLRTSARKYNTKGMRDLSRILERKPKFRTPLLELAFRIAKLVYAKMREEEEEQESDLDEGLGLVRDIVVGMEVLQKFVEKESAKIKLAEYVETIKYAAAMLGRDSNKSSVLFNAIQYISTRQSGREGLRGEGILYDYFPKLLNGGVMPTEVKTGGHAVFIKVLQEEELTPLDTKLDVAWGLLLNALDPFPDLAHRLGTIFLGRGTFGNGGVMTVVSSRWATLHNGRLEWALVQNMEDSDSKSNIERDTQRDPKVNPFVGIFDQPHRPPTYAQSQTQSQTQTQSQDSYDGDGAWSRSSESEDSEDVSDAAVRKERRRIKKKKKREYYLEKKVLSTKSGGKVAAPSEAHAILGDRQDAVVIKSDVLNVWIAFLNTVSEITLAHYLVTKVTNKHHQVVAPKQLYQIVEGALKYEYNPNLAETFGEIIRAEKVDENRRDKMHYLGDHISKDAAAAAAAAVEAAAEAVALIVGRAVAEAGGGAAASKPAAKTDTESEGAAAATVANENAMDSKEDDTGGAAGASAGGDSMDDDSSSVDGSGDDDDAGSSDDDDAGSDDDDENVVVEAVWDYVNGEREFKDLSKFVNDFADDNRWEGVLSDVYVSQTLKTAASLRRVLGYMSALTFDKANQCLRTWEEAMLIKLPTGEKPRAATIPILDRERFVDLIKFLVEDRNISSNFNEASHPATIGPMFLREIMNVFSQKTNGDATVFGDLLTALGLSTWWGVHFAHDRWGMSCLHGLSQVPAAGRKSAMDAFSLVGQPVMAGYGDYNGISEYYLSDPLVYVLPQNGEKVPALWFTKCLTLSRKLIASVKDLLGKRLSQRGAVTGVHQRQLPTVRKYVAKQLEEAETALKSVEDAMNYRVPEESATVEKILQALNNFYIKQDDITERRGESMHAVSGLFSEWQKLSEEHQETAYRQIISDSPLAYQVEDGEVTVPDLPASYPPPGIEGIVKFMKVCIATDALSNKVLSFLQPLIQYTKRLTDCCIRIIHTLDGHMIQYRFHNVDNYQLETGLAVIGPTLEALRIVKTVADQALVFTNPYSLLSVAGAGAGAAANEDAMDREEDEPAAENDTEGGGAAGAGASAGAGAGAGAVAAAAEDAPAPAAETAPAADAEPAAQTCGKFNIIMNGSTSLEEAIKMLRQWAKDQKYRTAPPRYIDTTTTVQQEDGHTEVHGTRRGAVYWWTDDDIIHALRELGNGLNTVPFEDHISVSHTVDNRSARIFQPQVGHWGVITNATGTDLQVEESEEAGIHDGLHKRGGDCGPSAVAIALFWVCYGIQPGVGTMELGGGHRTLKTPTIHSKRTRKARKQKKKRDRTLRSK